MMKVFNATKFPVNNHEGNATKKKWKKSYTHLDKHKKVEHFVFTFKNWSAYFVWKCSDFFSDFRKKRNQLYIFVWVLRPAVRWLIINFRISEKNHKKLTDQSKKISYNWQMKDGAECIGISIVLLLLNFI